MKKSITANYIYNLLYQIISLISPLVLVPFLTRALGGNNLGVFSYTLSIVTIFYSFSALGINLYAQREFAYCQDEKEKRSILFFELIIIRFLSTIIVLIIFLIFINITYHYSLLYYLFIPYLISNIFDITWLYQGMENFKNVSMINLSIKLLFIIIVIFFVKQPSDLYKYVIIYSFQFLITAIAFWFGLKKYIIKIDLKKLNICRHFRYIIVFFIPQIATTLYTILDRTMIGILVPNINNVYYYEQATYIVKTVLMLITSIGTVMISNSSYNYKKKEFDKINYNIRKIINFVWLLGVPLTFGICACIGNVVPWFYGKDYMDIVSLTQWLSPLILIIGLNNILGYQILIPLKRQNKYVMCVLIGTFFNIIVNYILISIIGPIGAAISSVLSELLILILESYMCRDIIKFKELFNNSFRYILIGILLFLISYSIKFIIKSYILLLFTQVIIGFVMYVSILIIIKDAFIKEHIIDYLKMKLEEFKNDKIK